MEQSVWNNDEYNHNEAEFFALDVRMINLVNQLHLLRTAREGLRIEMQERKIKAYADRWC